MREEPSCKGAQPAEKGGRENGPSPRPEAQSSDSSRRWMLPPRPPVLLQAREKASKSGLGPRQPCCSPCWKRLGLLFVPQLQMGSCPCLSGNLLFGRRRKSQGDAGEELPDATRAEFLLACLPEPRWVCGLRKPLPPSERGSRGLAPEGEGADVSAEKSILRHKNRPTTKQGGVVSETSPSSLEQKRQHVGRPRGFLELLGAEADPQWTSFPCGVPELWTWGGHPHGKGPYLCLSMF